MRCLPPRRTPPPAASGRARCGSTPGTTWSRHAPCTRRTATPRSRRTPTARTPTTGSRNAWTELAGPAILRGPGLYGVSAGPGGTAGVRLILGEADLQAELAKAGAAAERDCAAVIAERTGTDADHDLYPRLAAAALGAAVRVATEQKQHTEHPKTQPPLLREALGRLADGLPV